MEFARRLQRESGGMQARIGTCDAGRITAGTLTTPYYGRAHVVALDPITSPFATLHVCALEGAAPWLRPGESAVKAIETEIHPYNWEARVG